MKAILFSCEAGIIAIDESNEIIAVSKFKGASALDALNKIRRSPESELTEFLSTLKKKGFAEFVATDDDLRQSLTQAGYDASIASNEVSTALQLQKISLMTKAGLASSEEEAREQIRSFALEVSKEKLRALSTSPDLHVIQAVQALDEVDKSFNLLSTRLREWYGLHFPELDRLVEDPTTYVKIVTRFGHRTNIVKEEIQNLSLSEKRSEAILIAADKSKGGLIGDEDLARLSNMGEELLHLSSLREKLLKHLGRIMEDIAPNLSTIAGPSIGARLVARAGGLQRLASLPASTIQILGAERALFRALRTGAKPPKHGVIFQHQAVHSAPKWQRGKVARSLANKIAIAARIDVFRGTKEEGLERTFERRVGEIREKYPEPPRPAEQRLKAERRRKPDRK